MDELEEIKPIAEVIGDAMKMKGISAEKLSQLTGVSDRFIALLLDDKHEKLPSAPYVRGYLSRIGNTLNLNGEQLWTDYTKQHVVARSGKNDTLVTNKFEMKYPGAPVLAVGAVVIAGIIIFALRAPAFIGTPTLSLENFSETASTSTLDIRGKIDPKNQLTVNDEVVYPDEQGTFEKKVTLTVGFNTFRFKVKGVLGKEFETTKQVYLATSTKHVETITNTTTTE